MSGYNFTERVRKVLAMAREEAIALRHEYIGTEHILLAMVREREGVAAAVLDELELDRDALRQRILDVIKTGRGDALDLPYTSRAKKVLELAMTEARDLSHKYVGTEHILLGLIREERGIAAQVLADSGMTLDTARGEVLRLLGNVATSGSPAHGHRRWPGETTSSGSLTPIALPIRSLPPAEWATDRARSVIERAREEAANRHSRLIEPEHILIALLQEDGGMASTLMDLLGTDQSALRRAAAGAIEETLASDEPFDLEMPYSDSAEAVLRHAFHAARSGRDRRVGTDHVLLGLLLEESAPASRVLTEAGLTADRVRAKRSRIVG